MESHIESQSNQFIESVTKLRKLQQGLRSKLTKDKLQYEQSFKSIKLKIIESISNIKQTQLKILSWKLNKNMTDKNKKDIAVLEQHIDGLKIQLINDIKAKVKQVRKINEAYNLCLNDLIKLQILSDQELGRFKDLPIKMLHEYFAQGLPELLIQSNILSPYLKINKSQPKEYIENQEEINQNNKEQKNQSIQ